MRVSAKIQRSRVDGIVRVGGRIDARPAERRQDARCPGGGRRHHLGVQQPVSRRGSGSAWSRSRARCRALCSRPSRSLPAVDFATLEEVFVIPVAPRHRAPRARGAHSSDEPHAPAPRRYRPHPRCASCSRPRSPASSPSATWSPTSPSSGSCTSRSAGDRSRERSPGFFIGLALDLLSGSDGMLGLSALTKTVAGFIAGYFYNENKTLQTLGSYRFLVDRAASPARCIISFISLSFFREAGSAGGMPAPVRPPRTLYTAAAGLIPMFWIASQVRLQSAWAFRTTCTSTASGGCCTPSSADVPRPHRPALPAAAHLQRRIRQEVGREQHPDHPARAGPRDDVRPQRHARRRQPPGLHRDDHAVRIRPARDPVPRRACSPSTRQTSSRPPHERRSVFAVRARQDQARHRFQDALGPRGEPRRAPGRRLPGRIEAVLHDRRDGPRTCSATRRRSPKRSSAQSARDTSRATSSDPPDSRRSTSDAARSEGGGVQHGQRPRTGDRPLRQRDDTTSRPSRATIFS